MAAVLHDEEIGCNNGLIYEEEVLSVYCVLCMWLYFEKWSLMCLSLCLCLSVAVPFSVRDGCMVLLARQVLHTLLDEKTFVCIILTFISHMHF